MRMHGIMFFTGTKWTRQTTRTGMRPNGVSPRLPLRKFFVTVTGAGGQSGGRRSTRTASGQAFSTQGVLTFPLLFWIKRLCRCRERLSPACARTCIGCRGPPEVAVATVQHAHIIQNVMSDVHAACHAVRAHAESARTISAPSLAWQQPARRYGCLQRACFCMHSFLHASACYFTFICSMACFILMFQACKTRSRGPLHSTP